MDGWDEQLFTTPLKPLQYLHFINIISDSNEYFIEQIRPRHPTHTRPVSVAAALQAMGTSHMEGTYDCYSKKIVWYQDVSHIFFMFSVTGQYNLWNTNEGDMKELVYINPVTTSIQVAGRCDKLDLDLAGILLFATNLRAFMMSCILYSLSVFL